MEKTDEQEQIITAARASAGGASLAVDALAGTGKTTTLAMVAGELRGPSLALAFNKSIAEEMKKQFPSHFDIKTMNGLGFGALRRALPEVGKWDLDGHKLGKIVSQLARERKVKLPGDTWDAIRRVVTGAMLAGIKPGQTEKTGDGTLILTLDMPEAWLAIASDCGVDEADAEEVCEWAYAALVENNRLTETGKISFDDQVYWPIVFGAPFPRYGRVLVDEAQDLNNLNHAAVARVSGSETGWLGICGDPRQSIYRFRGSVSESMGRLQGLKPSWAQLGLTMTFRCPKAVVARQLEHVPRFRAAEANPDGLVLDWRNRPWDWEKLWDAGDEQPGQIAILCRNNAPLFSLAFKLLRERVNCAILGREIGKGLEALSRKVAGDDGTGIVEFLTRLAEWGETEASAASANGHEEKVDGIWDRVECLRVIAEGTRSAGELRGVLQKLFASDTPTVVLATIHKAKGLEWRTVVSLDPWRIPSKFAVRSGNVAELEQEWNLKYVLETRSKHTLILADAGDFGGED